VEVHSKSEKYWWSITIARAIGTPVACAVWAIV
jgi:hypothetical protein